MGQERTYVCTKCGTSVEIIEGSGMMWHSFDKDMFYPPKKGSFGLNFYDSIDEKTLAEAHKYIDKEEFVDVVDAYYQPYICKKCGKIESKIYFRIDSSKESYHPKYICECGGKYKRLTYKDKEHLHCVKCGANMYEEIEKYLYWD